MSEFEIIKTDLSPVLPPMARDYSINPGLLKQYYHFPPQLESFRKAIEFRKTNYHHRELLVEVLAKQYEKVQSGTKSAVTQIEKLKSENTFTVTTGHQLNIFTGPLYFIYKIISVIKLADQLKPQFPQFDFVPVYWMAGEDHDLLEINHFYIQNQKIEWSEPEAGPPCGRLKTDGLVEIADILLKQYQNNPELVKLLVAFKTYYSENKTLTDATRELVNYLFGEKGLLIINADDADLKKCLIPVIKDDFINSSAFNLVNRTVAEIEKKYKAQVHPRKINFFYLGNNIRDRLIAANDRYATISSGLSFTRDELLNEIETHPENFSPNVVIRPLYQELILPNLAYVGGPSEISYWMEYKTFFEYHQMRLPVLLLRDSFLWIDESLSSLLEKADLDAEDFLQDEPDIIKKFLLARSPDAEWIMEAQSQIETVYGKLAEQIVKIDPTLKATVNAEKQKVNHGIKNIEEKLRKSIKRKEETALNRIQKIKSVLYPDGVFQERHDNLLDLVIRFKGNLFELLYQNANPIEAKLKIIQSKS